MLPAIADPMIHSRQEVIYKIKKKLPIICSPWYRNKMGDLNCLLPSIKKKLLIMEKIYQWIVWMYVRFFFPPRICFLPH